MSFLTSPATTSAPSAPLPALSRMARLSLLLGALLFAASAAAAPRFDSLFHQPYSVRAPYFFRSVLPALRQMPSAAARRTLDSLERAAVQLDDPEARLEIRTNALEFNKLTGHITNDQCVAALEKLLAEPGTQRYPEYAAVIMASLGNSYFGIRHDYTRAFDYLIRAYKIAAGFSSTAFSDKKLIYLWLGNRYYTLGDYARSEKVLLEADTIGNARDYTSLYNCKNTLGLIYRARGQHARALNYFVKARDLAREGGDTTWAAIASGNIGITHYLQGHFAQALPLLRQDVAQSFGNAGYPKDNGMNSLLIMADIHQKRGRTIELEADIALARQFLDSCRDRVKPLAMLYPILASYHYGRADYKTAYGFLDSAKQYGDSISRRDNIYKLAVVEHRHELEHAATAMERLSKEKTLLAYARNGLLAGILLFIISAALFINRLRLRHRLREARLSGDKQNVEHALQHATIQLDRYTQHLHEKNLIIEKAGENMQELLARIDDARAQEHNAEVMQQLYQSTILTDDQWSEFKLLFEQVHKGYLQRLRQKMPDLTPADTRFIVLSKLNLSNKEMAGILGVQVETIRGYKHRLKKRFELFGEASIKEFVDAI